MSGSEAKRLTLVGRGYCHLCDDMREALSGLIAGHAVVLKELDVDADPDLLAKYDELVPVLLDGEGRELCHYHIDAGRVVAYLQGTGP